MNPEKILRNVALWLATGLLIIVSVIWGAGALRLLTRSRAARSPEHAAASGGFESRCAPEPQKFADERRGGLLETEERILRESFERLSLEEAVTLVGLLHCSRIVLAKGGASRDHDLEVPPLRLRQAVESVSFLFGWNRRWLEAGFRERWQTLRHGPLADRIAFRLARHPAVERIEEAPDLPGCA